MSDAEAWAVVLRSLPYYTRYISPLALAVFSAVASEEDAATIPFLLAFVWVYACLLGYL